MCQHQEYQQRYGASKRLKKEKNYDLQWRPPVGIPECKPSLIDFNPEMGRRGKPSRQPERLSERAPRTGDAIVRSASNKKMQR